MQKFFVLLFLLALIPIIVVASPGGLLYGTLNPSKTSYGTISPLILSPSLPKKSMNSKYGEQEEFAQLLKPPLRPTKLLFRLHYNRELYAQSGKNSEEGVVGLEEVEEEFSEELDLDFGEEFANELPEEDFDPLSDYNEVMTEFNIFLYTNVLFPVTRGYRWVIPEGGRLAVKRFFTNILFPIRFVNNLLQLKVINAGEETLRFAINSTVGLLGLFDPAKIWFGLEAHEEDFGQTLGYYGVGGGFHIVLPFLGPSNLRDTVSIYPDNQMDLLDKGSLMQKTWNQKFTTQLNYQPDLYQWLGVTLFENINDVSFTVEVYEGLWRDALDIYLVNKEFYEQNRNKKIKE